MESFSAEWLALREPVDHAARSDRLVELVAARFAAIPSVHVLDLGSGTGSNARYTAPRFPRPQRWTLVDHDALLLAEAVRRRPHTLNGDDIDVATVDLAGRVDPRFFEGRALVTASALLDLVSDAWLRNVAAHCVAVGAVVLFALSYNGVIESSPMDADDETIRTLVNRHQRSDKGFGPALGPDAAAVTAKIFERRGYHVERARSDWLLGEAELELQQQLIAGWARAATEMEPSHAFAIAAWQGRRVEHLHAGRSRVVVGHEDLAAWPI